MFQVKCQGAEVAFHVDGSGTPLILIHGTGGNAESNWGMFVESFSQEWKVIRPEYSGSGATKDDGRVLTVDYLVAQIIAAADAAGAKTFHLLGFSLGAALAAKIAGDYPERVLSLILLAGFTSSHDARAKFQFELWRDLIATDRRAMSRLILLTGLSPDGLTALGSHAIEQAVEDSLTNADWEGMARQVSLNLAIDVKDCIAKITAPTLVIGCTHDHMVPPSHSRTLARKISSARYAELPTGHLAPMEQPEAFSELVIAFLREQETSSDHRIMPL